MRSRLFWKLYLGCLVLILVTAGAVGLTLGRRLEQESHRHFHDRLATAAALARELATTAPAGTNLTVVVRHVSELAGVRATFLAADGTVLADSDRDARTLENHADRPEILAARTTGRGTATRLSESLGVEMMYFALATGSRDGVAFVRTALPLDEIVAQQATLRRATLAGITIAAVVGLFVSFLLSRSFTRPLVDMAATAREISAGRHGMRLDAQRRDELGGFARSFNVMAAQLADQIDDLTEDRNRLQAILAAMAEGVVAVDAEGRVLHLNAVAARILGSDPAAARGKPFASVTRVKEVADLLGEAVRTGVGRSREMVLAEFPKDRILEIQTAPIPGDEGEAPAGAVVVLHDVTELRRLEAIRRDFVTNVSHELKTPLTAVRGVVETLVDDREMSAATRERFLRKLDDQSRRLARIVTDLLSLARIESRREDLEREHLDFRQTVNESVRALSGLAEERRLALTSRLPDAEVPVRGDRPSLRLLVDNLVDNAIKYTPEGGKVTVRLVRRDRWALLEVEDTGIGIEDRHRERLFERFYRVDKARSRDLGGTGLGLSIVKHVALAHDGEVTFESVAAEGSTFRVRLPIEPTPAARQA